MGIFVSGSSRKPRGFDYEPRYYDPEEDEEQKRSDRIKHRMHIKSKTRRGKATSLVYLLALLSLTIFMYFAL